ncbi:hypothetical protein EAS65_12880 [Enterococcus faecium]|nr:hypothetical protein EAS65_12880 [Enterococcus faecium]
MIKIVPFVCNLKGISIHILDIQMVDFRRTLEVTEATVVIDFKLCETVSAKKCDCQISINRSLGSHTFLLFSYYFTLESPFPILLRSFH